MSLNGKSVLVTGGTGFFGKKFIEVALNKYKSMKLIVFSRDEMKQFDLQQVFPQGEYPSIRYYIGDIRDKERLYRAFNGVDIVIHAAALKQIPSCEFNPFEAIQTNIIGTQNIIEVAIDRGVQKVLALSTDKAVNPASLYGASKLCMENLIIQSNFFSQMEKTKLSCVRYGNVMGSWGSVVEVFLKQRETGKITVTDPRMTRFWITLNQGVEFVIDCLERMHGGEVFVPKIPSIRIMDLAEAVSPGCEIEIIGIRPGEKLHELLLSRNETRHASEYDDMYIIKPEFTYSCWHLDQYEEGKAVPEGFEFTSNTNDRFLTPEVLRKMIGKSES